MENSPSIGTAVIRSLQLDYPTANTGLLANRLNDPAITADAFESSVRGGAKSPPCSGRIMIEQAPTNLFAEIATSLDIPIPARSKCFIDVALREQVPLITGWDVRGGGAQRCAKLYVNASDASSEVRLRIFEELVPGHEINQPPAVIGMNARADGEEEIKVYLQHAEALEAARGTTSDASDLAANAWRDGADSGAVLSLDVGDDNLTPRAFFVALKEPPPGLSWPCLATLPGYDSEEIAKVLPFSPAPPRSVGLSLIDSRWTAYFKPRGSSRAPESLEPFAIFTFPGGEVGIFVEPSESAQRAFRRTDRYAVSLRIRSGQPEPVDLERLVDWFCASLHRVEQGATSSPDIDNPPQPWNIFKD